MGGLYIIIIPRGLFVIIIQFKGIIIMCIMHVWTCIPHALMLGNGSTIIAHCAQCSTIFIMSLLIFIHSFIIIFQHYNNYDKNKNIAFNSTLCTMCNNNC